MDSNDRSHLIISKESINKIPVVKTGRGTSYNRNDLASHSQVLLRNFSAITSEFEKSKDIKLVDSITISVKTPNDWDVKNEKYHLEDLGFSILEYSRNDKSIATVNIPKAKWVEVGHKIKNYAETSGVGKTNLQAIDGFIKRPLNDSVLIENIDKVININASITFFNILNPKELISISNEVLKDLEKDKSSAKLINLSDSDIIISCMASIQTLKNIANNYITIRSIVNDEEVKIERASLRSTAYPLTAVSQPTTNQTIAVVDDGIFQRNDLAPLITSRLPPQVPQAVAAITTHGTYVASRCAFGDIDLSAISKPLLPVCFLSDIPVFGLNSTGNIITPKETDLIKVIDDFVSKNYKTVRVYNLSLGFSSPLSLNKFSETAKRLDYLSRKYDVLFVVSSGNIDGVLGNYPEGHFKSPNATIMSPSESILCLCVGSIAKNIKPTSMSQRNEISAFSRIGPGLFGSIKPELVAHGGNLDANFVTDPDLATFGFSTTNGMIDNNVGTSFSAPIISHYAAQLYDYYPMFGTNMVRALLVHNAINRNFPQNTNLPCFLGSGYGEPELIKCIETSGNSCVYLAEGNLTTTKYDIVKFYVPSVLSKGKQIFVLKVTITFDPEVNRNNDQEYSCSRISSQIMKLKKGKLGLISASEANLSEPYSTIVQYSHAFKRSIEAGEWAIRLRLFARNVDQDNYNQKYSIVIQLSDELNKYDLRSYVVKEMGHLYGIRLLERKMA